MKVSFKIVRETTIVEDAVIEMDIPDYVRSMDIQKGMAEEFAKANADKVDWTFKTTSIEIEDVQRVTVVPDAGSEEYNIDWNHLAQPLPIVGR